MPLEDISQVTVSLRRLLENAITPTPTISTSPPERVEGATNLLNLYCYHANQDPHNRIRPRQQSGRAIATSPLTLELHYILTAHTLVNSEFDTLAEQNLLGRAMKALHDFPVLDDNSAIGSTRILPDDIQGLDNRFEISLVQMTATEALTFWANENEITAKPSAYYTVRPVEIEPARPTQVPGVVLSLGAFIASNETPYIGATESVLPYVLPAVLGGGPASLTASPAKVGPITAEATNVMRLKGASLSKGVAQDLLLSHAHWGLLFPDQPRIAVDMAANAPLGWSQALTAAGAEIELGEELHFDRPDGTTVTLALYPGGYAASWRVRSPFDGPAGPEFVEQRSNEAAFTVNPRITGFARDNATGAVTLEFGGAWLLNRGRPLATREEPELDILVSVDGPAYVLDEANPAPGAPGSFTVGDHALTYLPFPAADQSGLRAVTVVVNGAETQPFWYEIP
jgi:hypothetical protein